MRNWKAILVMLTVAISLLMPSAAFAAKKYQVTGKVLAFDDNLITVQKDDEKWEIYKANLEKNSDSIAEKLKEIGI